MRQRQLSCDVSSPGIRKRVPINPQESEGEDKGPTEGEGGITSGDDGDKRAGGEGPASAAAPPKEPTRRHIPNGMSSEELERLKAVDPRKYKRILANRASAARSKERRQQYIRDMEDKVDRLRHVVFVMAEEGMVLEEDLHLLEAKAPTIEEAAAQVRAELTSSRAKLEILMQRFDQMAGPGAAEMEVADIKAAREDSSKRPRLEDQADGESGARQGCGDVHPLDLLHGRLLRSPLAGWTCRSCGTPPWSLRAGWWTSSLRWWPSLKIMAWTRPQWTLSRPPSSWRGPTPFGGWRTRTGSAMATRSSRS